MSFIANRATESAVQYSSPNVSVSTASDYAHADWGSGRSTDIIVVSEHDSGRWSVLQPADRLVRGSYETRTRAVEAAFELAALGTRWEIHVLDRFGYLVHAALRDEQTVASDALRQH